MYVTNIYADNFTLYRCASSFSSVLSSSSVRPNSLWGTTNRRRQHSTTLSSVQKEMKKGQWQPFKAIINILRLFFFFILSLMLAHSLTSHLTVGVCKCPMQHQQQQQHRSSDGTAASRRTDQRTSSMRPTDDDGMLFLCFYPYTEYLK